MTDIIIIAVVLLMALGAAAYVIRQKKRGAKCIGCPYSGSKSCSCKLPHSPAGDGSLKERA